MSRHDRDYYTVLGIDRDASAVEIGRAYKRAARATHPDVHPDEPAAAERFSTVTIAYETLGNPTRRAAYDRTHAAARPTHRVEPAIHWSAAPTPEPVHHGRSLRPRPEPPFSPVHRITRVALIDDELLELTAALSRLLYATRHLP
jgi:curved DNA-binding protein CbpA